MKLEEGIKLQKELLSLLPEVGFNKYIASTKLGIGALKWVKENRTELERLQYGLLPGETKE